MREFRPVNVTDQELRDGNDMTAAMAVDDDAINSCRGHFFNAVICELQARRAAQPDTIFVSGANVLVPRSTVLLQEALKEFMEFYDPEEGSPHMRAIQALEQV